MNGEWRVGGRGTDGSGHHDPLDAGRSRYDSATWRRIYDSVVWRWAVGPIVYITVVAAVWVVIFGNSIAGGIVFGAFLALLVTAGTILNERRGNRSGSG